MIRVTLVDAIRLSTMASSPSFPCLAVRFTSCSPPPVVALRLYYKVWSSGVKSDSYRRCFTFCVPFACLFRSGSRSLCAAPYFLRMGEKACPHHKKYVMMTEQSGRNWDTSSFRTRRSCRRRAINVPLTRFSRRRRWTFHLACVGQRLAVIERVVMAGNDAVIAVRGWF